jgi:hypothetical protein
MVDVDPAVRDEYRAAWDAWRKQLDALHAPRLKGLLNRETRAKARYDDARRALLGISDDSLAAAPGPPRPPGPPRG